MDVEAELFWLEFRSDNYTSHWQRAQQHNEVHALTQNNSLTKVVFDTIDGHLAEKGLLLKEDTIADATIIAARPSTKNKTNKRDPDLHQTKKGNEWYFGMKAHIGVDADSGLAHNVVITAANVNDVTQAHALLHAEETHAFGDAGYTGVTSREENQAS